MGTAHIRYSGKKLARIKFGESVFRTYLNLETTDTDRIRITQYRNVWQFLIWRFSANSPIRQIKNLAKLSRYTVCAQFAIRKWAVVMKFLPRKLMRI